MLSSTLILLFILPSFTTDAVNCTQNYACIPASNFTTSLAASPETLKFKECGDGCANYYCIIDKKKVIFGGGCYSDYERDCKDAPAAARIDPKLIIPQPQVLTAPGHFLMVSSVEDRADIHFDMAIFKYNDFFNNQFLHKSNLTYNEKCEYPEATTTKPPHDDTVTITTTNGGLMNQKNGCKLFEMILLGFILAQFW